MRTVLHARAVDIEIRGQRLHLVDPEIRVAPGWRTLECRVRQGSAGGVQRGWEGKGLARGTNTVRSTGSDKPTRSSVHYSGLNPSPKALLEELIATPSVHLDRYLRAQRVTPEAAFYDIVDEHHLRRGIGDDGAVRLRQTGNIFRRLVPSNPPGSDLGMRPERRLRS